MPRLVRSCESDLRASGWRDLIAQHGLGSIDELLCGRGPDGLVDAHAEHLCDTSVDLRFDETSCRLLEKHGLYVPVVAAMISFVDYMIIENDDGGQIAAIGRRDANIAVTTTWDGPRWQVLGHRNTASLQNLPAVPISIAVAAQGRLVSEIVNDAGSSLCGTVQEMTTSDASSEITACKLVFHDTRGIQRRRA